MLDDHDPDDYQELVDRVENFVADLYQKEGAMVFPVLIHTSAALASVVGYGHVMRYTLLRSIEVVNAIDAEPEGTLQ